MGSGEAERAAVAGDEAEHSGAFHDFESVFAEVAEDREGFGDGGSVDHEGGFRVAESGRNGVGALVEADFDAFGAEFVGERSRSAVIARDILAGCEEIAFEGCHADASGAHEIYVGCGCYIVFHF